MMFKFCLSLCQQSRQDRLGLVRMICLYGAYTTMHYNFIDCCLFGSTCVFYRQAATEPNVNLIERARQHGWTTDKNCRSRIKYKTSVFLERTSHCFSALTEEEMSQYLKAHADVCRLSPSMKNRDKTVDQLIELRLPAPELSTNSSTSFRSMLYELMLM